MFQHYVRKCLWVFVETICLMHMDCYLAGLLWSTWRLSVSRNMNIACHVSMWNKQHGLMNEIMWELGFLCAMNISFLLCFPLGSFCISTGLCSSDGISSFSMLKNWAGFWNRQFSSFLHFVLLQNSKFLESVLHSIFCIPLNQILHYHMNLINFALLCQISISHLRKMNLNRKLRSKLFSQLNRHQ